MAKRFFTSLPKVSDALNGIIGYKRLSIIQPFTGYKNSGTKTKALVALGIVCIFWGTTWIASKQGVKYMPALQMAGIRQTIGGLFYVVYFLVRRTPLPKGKEWWPILMLSFLNFMLSNGLSTWGLRYVSAGLGSIIGAIFPLWLVIIGLINKNETKMSRTAMVGLTLGFGGICVIFYEHLPDFLNADFRFGIVLSLIATWSWAFGTIYTKKHALNFNPYFALGLQMVISGPLLYLLSYFTKNTVPFQDIPWQSWTAIAYLALFGSVFSFIAYLYALQNLSTQQASIYAYINPVVALLIGALFFGEILTISIAIGVCITLYGVWLVRR